MEIFSGWQGLNYNYWEHFGSLWKWLGPIHNYFVKWKVRLELSKIEGVFFKKENRESGRALKRKGGSRQNCPLSSTSRHGKNRGGGRRRPRARGPGGLGRPWRRGKRRGGLGGSIPLPISSSSGPWRRARGGRRRSPEMVVVAALRVGGLEVAGELVVLEGCVRAYL